MRSATAVASVVLAGVLSVPVGAQYRAPAGVERFEPTPTLEPSAARARPDTTESRSEIHVVRGIIGGVIGGVGGALLGTQIGVSTASGCQGELCQLGPAVLGFGLGESIGLAIGTHLGAGGRGNVAMTALTSLGTLAGGLVVAAAAPRGTPAVAVTLIPIAQLAVALLMER